MQYYTEPAICPNCGKDTYYNVIISCNSFMMNMLPSNRCSCGYDLSEDDIDLSKASPSYREYIRDRKISKYIDNITNKEPESWRCEKCGCTKSSAYIIRLNSEIPDEYKNNEKVTINNSYKRCSKCGHDTQNTFQEYSGLYDLIKVMEDGSFLCKKKDNYERKFRMIWKKREKQYKKAEKYLMSIGEITTIDEEDEYADKYYGKHIDRKIRKMMRF